MFASSKRTIAKILCLYLGTSAIFLCIGFYFLNMKQTENIVFIQMSNLRDISFEILDSMRKNGHDIKKALPEILNNVNVPFAIYDKNNDLIFSNLSHTPNIKEHYSNLYRINDKVIVNPDLHPKNKKPMKKMPYTIFVEDNNVDSAIIIMRLQLIVAFICIFVIMGIVAYILVRLFLKPINEYIKTLDMFIKDTTHEINTPLSVILMSIETLKKEHSEEQKKLDRIKLASLQLNQIYNTLVAHNFPHSVQNRNERFALDVILKERLEFFSPFFIQKKLSIKSDINETFVHSSKNKWIIVFDNLISNAIKYNHKGGSIEIYLNNGEFVIKDSGCGISSDNIDKIYERYSRFSEDSGGFGIGLSLVKKICDEYHIHISVHSTPQGSEFKLIWHTI